MSDRIDRLCEQLRIKLHGIDRRLEALKAKQLGYFREVAASGGKPDGQRAAAYLRPSSCR
jgi:hypothetical protein